MGNPVAAPRPAASILLVRDDPVLQVFMAVRHHQIDFASGAMVFPGGKVSEDDRRHGWHRRIDGDLGPLNLFGIAAIRETFEESGLLIARTEQGRGSGRPLAGAGIAEALAPHRSAVDRGETSFLDLCAAHGLVLALDRLIHFAHWITPEFMPKRFDTHFFVARVPAGQIAAHDGRETTDSEWLAPADGLAREAAGEVTMLFPTRLNLELLVGADGVECALADAQARPVVPVMPVLTDDEDNRRWLEIPRESGYATWRIPAPKRPG